ncbi:MAG: o-succinylbenzoate synthase [Saprospiraceae bacterium]
MITSFLQASFQKHTLEFKQASGTSRGILRIKESWFIVLKNEKTWQWGIGECGLLKGLSADDRPGYEKKLKEVCENISNLNYWLDIGLLEFPSIQFGLEMAWRSYQSEDKFQLFPSEFTEGKKSIPINGLVWMGEEDFMRQQIEDKINQGFDCVKMKIGAIDFDTEIKLLKNIRKRFSKNEIEIRVDANGAFQPGEDALQKLNTLAKLDIHSIEQPIKQGQIEEMEDLCCKTPLPIALDEELIGVFKKEEKEELITFIQPQYIILKPSFVGGFKGSQEWIDAATRYDIPWWITSALESNVGLNAIAQWTFSLNNPMHQGLGTGGLYTNNFPSPLFVEQGALHFNPKEKWDLRLLNI